MADIMRNWDAVNAEDGWMKRDKRYAVKGTVRLQPGTIKSMLGYLKQFLQSLQHYMCYEHVYIATALCTTDTWMRNSNKHLQKRRHEFQEEVIHHLLTAEQLESYKHKRGPREAITIMEEVISRECLCVLMIDT